MFSSRPKCLATGTKKASFSPCATFFVLIFHRGSQMRALCSSRSLVQQEREERGSASWISAVIYYSESQKKLDRASNFEREKREREMVHCE